MPELIMRTEKELEDLVERIVDTLDRLRKTPERLFPFNPERARIRAELLATTGKVVTKYIRMHAYTHPALMAHDRTITWDLLQITLITLLSHCVDAKSRALTRSMQHTAYYRRAHRDLDSEVE